MGTPQFAVPSLKALINAGHEIAAALTQPDKPRGRGMEEAFSPVKVTAMEARIKVLQPVTLRDNAFLDELKMISPVLIAVVAYGKILPEAVLKLPPKGCVNLHASLLPKYRGAAPINRAIINGDKETGACTMLMDKGMDTGAVLLAEKITIGADETAGGLSTRLSEMGALLLVKTIGLIEKDAVKPAPQDEKEASYAPMLKKEDGRINWRRSAEEVGNLARGVSPWPGAFAYLNGKLIKIHAGRALTGPGQTTDKPGVVIEAGPASIKVQCERGVFEILEMQAEGKRRMSAPEFLKGFRVNAGDAFA